MRRLDWIWVAILCALTGVLHFPLFRAGAGTLFSDLAIFHLVALDFIHGRFQIFPYGQTYGGLSLTCFRALGILIGSALGFKPLDSSFAFSYFFIPSLQVFLAYWALLRAHSRTAALAAALVTACGFEFWNVQFNNDYYPPVVLLAFFLIGVRGPLKGWPVRELGSLKLFWLSLLSGAAFYTNRMCFAAILVFWFPWESFPWKAFLAETRLVLTARLAPVQAAMRAAIFAVAGIWAYTWAFGSSFGSIDFFRWHFSGLKFNADSTSRTLACAGFAALACWYFRGERRSETLRFLAELPRRKLGVVAGGLFLGFAPELVYRALSPGPHRSFVRETDLDEFSRLLASIPWSLKELFGWGGSAFQHLTIVLMLLGGIGAFRYALDRSEKTLVWKNISLGISLSLLFYLGFRQHEVVVLRYLYPAQPFLIAGVGATFAKLWERPVNRGWVALLLAASCLYQVAGRLDPVTQERYQKVGRTFWGIAMAPELGHYDFVLVDDYAKTHVLTLLTDRKPIFYAANENTLHDLARVQDLVKQERVGFLETVPGSAPQQQLDLYGARWCLNDHVARIPLAEGASLYEMSRGDSNRPCSPR